jgi:hypothetical protein
MDNGIDINDLPGARGRPQGGNAGLVKPRAGLHQRIHRPEIRHVPRLPEAWDEPPRVVTFTRGVLELIALGLKFLILTALSITAVVGVAVGGYLLIEAAVTLVFDAIVRFGDWLLSAVQGLAQWAIEAVVSLVAGLVVGVFELAIALVVGTIELVLGGLIWVAASLVEGVVGILVFLFDALVGVVLGLLSFVVDLFVAIVDGLVHLFIDIIDFLFGLLLAGLLVVGVVFVVSLLSPILIPLALAYLVFVAVF